MNKIALLLPLLLVGCASQPIPVQPTAHAPQIVSVAGGTTGTVSYSCTQFTSSTDSVPFRCQFHNETDQLQSEVRIKIGLYSEATSRLVAESSVISSFTMAADETDTHYLFWKRAEIEKVCGRNLRGCVVLVEKSWRYR